MLWTTIELRLQILTIGMRKFSFLKKMYLLFSLSFKYTLMHNLKSYTSDTKDTLCTCNKPYRVLFPVTEPEKPKTEADLESPRARELRHLKFVIFHSC